MTGALATPALCTDRAGECIFANDAWRGLSGLARDQSEGHGWADAVHPRDRAEVLTAYKRFLEDAEPLVVRCRFARGASDAAAPWVQLTASRMPDAVGGGVLIQVEDVTAVHEARVALSMQVRTLELVDDLCPVGQWRVEPTRGFWGSGRLHALLGTQASEGLGLDDWLERHLDADRASAHAQLSLALEHGTAVDYTAWVRGADGVARRLRVLGRAQWDADGVAVAGLFGVARELPPPRAPSSSVRGLVGALPRDERR